jgi:tetratricopeptide (TPR) repeat protein
MSDLTPTAAGTLSATPLPNLLAYMLDRALTGTLVVEDPAGQKSAVSFEHGHPTKARTAESVILIGQLLVELGLLDRSVAEQAAEQALARQTLYGVYLVATDTLPPARMEEALREQFRQRIRWMFSLPPASVYGFYDRLNLLEHWGGDQGTAVAVLPLVWQGIREHAAEERVQAVLARLGQQPLRLHSEAHLGRFEFNPSEQALADVLRAKPRRLDSLLAVRLVEERIARRMIYLLAITRHLDLGTGGRPIGVEEHSHAPARSRQSGQIPTGTAAPSIPPSSRSTEELARRVAELARHDLYGVLGVARHASTTAIQTAFVRLAKQWHPDRSTPESDDVRQLVIQAFARLSEAHAVLVDPGARRQYDHALEQALSDEERNQVARVLGAAAAYLRAEVLFKKGNLAGAEREVKTALEGDPDQSDYLSLYAWIEASQPERIATGRWDDLIALLTRALKQGPPSERTHFWRGQLLKRAGRWEEAQRDFHWVVHNNRHHVDAARELRLYEMRRGSDKSNKSGERLITPVPGRTTPPSMRAAEPGILGKLFKR